jgi:hypothetical protein
MFKRKYSLNQKTFSSLNEESAYWIGFLYADGYINQNRFQLVLSRKDRQVLEQFKNFIGSDRPIRDFYVNNGGEASEIRFRSWNMVKDVRPYELHVTKRKRNRLCPALLQYSIFPHFLRGLFDGDGGFYVDQRGYMTAELTGTMTLLSDVKQMLIHFDVLPEKRKITRNGKVMHRIRFIPSETIKLGKLLYTKGLKYKMKRKYDTYRSHVERLNEVTVSEPERKHKEGLRLSLKAQT